MKLDFIKMYYNIVKRIQVQDIYERVTSTVELTCPMLLNGILSYTVYEILFSIRCICL